MITHRHCHIAQVTGRFRTIDDYASTSIAALWGGTTTVMDFGIPRDSTESPLEAAKAKLELARQSRSDVALHGAVIDWDETVPNQLEELAELGIRSVKMYMTNRGTTIAENDTVLKVMKEMVRLDGLTYIHAEHDAIIVDCTAEHAAAGKIGIEHLHETRPELAEEASVREVLAMAEYTGAPVYFVHQSTARAVDLVTEARARGLDIHSETCPHYLVLDDGVYASRFPEWYSCCPPMRSAETVAALRRRFADGSIHTVSSDHSCYDLTQKRERTEDIRQMPHGLPGVETRMPVAFTALAETLTTGEKPADSAPSSAQTDLLERFVELFSAAPARINALPGKGVIAAGYDADLVVFNPDETRTVNGEALHMGTDFSPFHGLEMRGWPQIVVAGGRLVLDERGFHDPGPVGRYIARLGYRETATATTSQSQADNETPSNMPAPAGRTQS
ncbi:amidohydrolase family protein [Arthrobacter sp. H14-L1]|nr:amidohydrolase family protein [Arthrobacter sp. H14-L1]